MPSRRNPKGPTQDLLRGRRDQRLPHTGGSDLCWWLGASYGEVQPRLYWDRRCLIKCCNNLSCGNSCALVAGTLPAAKENLASSTTSWLWLWAHGLTSSCLSVFVWKRGGDPNDSTGELGGLNGIWGAEFLGALHVWEVFCWIFSRRNWENTSTLESGFSLPLRYNLRPII